MRSSRLMNPLGIILLFAAITILNDACTKTSLIGVDILPPDDALNIISTDTLTMFTTSVTGDSVRTYSPVSTQQLSNYFVGRTNDPIFGKSTAISYAQTRLVTVSPDFTSTTLDSVILTLAYDANKRHYGNTTGSQTIIVSRLTEDMDAAKEYYSNKLFSTGQVLGQKTFVPNFGDSLTILVPEGDTVLSKRVQPQVRIPLSNNFGNELLNNSANMGTITDYLEYFKGIALKGGSNNDALLSFNLFASDITLFYTQKDSTFDTDGTFAGFEYIAKKFIFPINSFSAKSSYFFNDRTGVGSIRLDAPITEYLNKNQTDSLIFVQAMEGVDAKITFPYLSALAGTIINKAELIVTVANRDDLDLFTFLPQLIVLKDGETSRVIIEDVAVSISTGGDFELLGGAAATEVIGGVSYTTYTINISAYFQSMVDGITNNNSIYLSAYPKSQIANRVILGGAGHSAFPIKFNLAYTKIK